MGRHRLTCLHRPVAPLAFSLFALTTGCGGASSPPDESVPAASGVVARVNDGDTLTLRSGTKIRLLQIDAPELTTDCYGRAARRALAQLAPVGARVRLAADPALDDHDRYRRLLRYVLVGDMDVNVELVREGAASPYFFRGERGRHAKELLGAVEAARDERRGYWGACPDARLNPGLGSLTGPA